MRFAAAHKTSTYLVVSCAFFALVGGGGLSPIASTGGLVAMIASWWWESPRIRFERLSWVWTVLTVLVFGGSVLTTIATLDVLLAGAHFLVWLMVVKLFNRRAARDWQQLYLLAFLMLVAGSVLNPDLTYGLFFFGYVISATWALTLFHLRREMEDNLLVKHAADRASERVEVRRILDSRRIVNGRFFLGTGLLSFGVFLGAAIVFLALPRVGMGFFLKSRGGVVLAGFSDGVKLGGHGVIKQDATVVMRVELPAKYGDRDAGAIHWRGVAFDQYSNGEWSRSSSAPETRQTLEASKTIDRRVLLWAGPSLSIPEIERLARTSVKQEVWLDPLDSDVLFGASNPRILEYAHTLRRKNPIEHNDEIRLEHGATVHYTVWSELEAPPASALLDTAAPLPDNFSVYRRLPPEITQRTRDLARTITAGARTDYEKAVAIKAWLQRNLTYTLELEDPKTQEPVDFFLFDRKQGHCEYFASAFAILGRAAGLAVRNVNGFLGGEWNEYQGYVAVRAGDAHSRDEVFFRKRDGRGVWITFDPTPPGDVDELGRGSTGWRAKLRRFFDTLRFQWSKWVIEYDLVSQLSLFKDLGGLLKSAGGGIKDALGWAKTQAIAHWPITVAVGAVIGALVILRTRRRWRRRIREREERPRPRVPSRIGELYGAIVRQLAKAGFARDPAVTPREHAAQLVERGAPGAARLVELVELYNAAEWGGHGGDEARATALVEEIRAALTAHRRARANLAS
jgi:protein-glutamine gamma-glutamyltransferase